MIVISPTHAWISKSLRSCNESLVVSSPYIGVYLRNLVSELDQGIAVRILTRTLLTDFASGASDLEAVRALAARTAGVLSLSSLHAKVYVIDGCRALVTSANATFSGMYRNRECGIEITVRREARHLRDLNRVRFRNNPKTSALDG